MIIFLKPIFSHTAQLHTAISHKAAQLIKLKLHNGLVTTKSGTSQYGDEIVCLETQAIIYTLSFFDLENEQPINS